MKETKMSYKLKNKQINKYNKKFSKSTNSQKLKRKQAAQYFIERAQAKFGDKFDYSKVKYKNMDTKVTIICPDHGKFRQMPMLHLYSKTGCPKCSQECLTISKEKFKQKAEKVHGNKYTLIDISYKTLKDKIKVKCNICGNVFYPTAGNFIRKSRATGCPVCARKRITKKSNLTQEEFLKRVKDIYGEKFDFSESIYESRTKKIKVKCNNCGNIFYITGTNLLNKKKPTKCPKCGRSKTKMKRLNTEEFIRRAREIHGDYYDYSLVNYIKGDVEVTIICPKHGPFKQKPRVHLISRGCAKCGSEKNCLTTEEFIARAKKVHGNKYDYSLVNYKNKNSKLKIICPKHGVFEQEARVHLNSKIGCVACSLEERKMGKEEFIRRAKELYGNYYDYSKVKYENIDKKVTIICPKHGMFEQTPFYHLNNKIGCPKCSLDNTRMTTEEFIAKAKKIHNNKYDYSKTKYINTRTPVTIICPIHGEFQQKPNNHLQNQGCPTV